tara:strand:+ start:6196 stop:6813 length:618 start_codon:yes stop_codon:yes gene_type:complete
MIDIDDFLPEVLRYAPNANDLVAQRFIRQAARELCQRCKLWKETDTIVITTPELQGVLTIEDADIVMIEAAKLDDTALEPKTTAWLDAEHPWWTIDTTPSGPARYVTQLQPNTVTVVPAVEGTLKARMVLRPSRKAATLPSFLLERYSEEIGRGAAGRMLMEPDSENPQLGLVHAGWFDQRLNTLAIEAIKGQQGAPLRTRGSYL